MPLSLTDILSEISGVLLKCLQQLLSDKSLWLGLLVLILSLGLILIPHYIHRTKRLILYMSLVASLFAVIGFTLKMWLPAYDLWTGRVTFYAGLGSFILGLIAKGLREGWRALRTSPPSAEAL